jgi:uncharacterized lipoprotein NlpE involved in copper resistance
MMKFTLCTLTVVLVLAGCAERHDVAYYKAHPNDRDFKIAACKSQPGAFSNDAECISAAEAEEVFPVSYWRANSTARQHKLADCKEYAATLGKSANCENASRAANAVLGAGKAIYLPAAK